ncbi:MAG: tyrosine-type recombinase/integrase [Lachnospiraceae bacterium]|nr:tyrosine-type recombinase/integrase [Lachnospiraceae bacterium]
MHVLRHTFAARCIESGMRSKTLQMILGQPNIGITMNLYVHVTDDKKAKEVQNIEKMLKIV